jgi:hypothetical protein
LQFGRRFVGILHPTGSGPESPVRADVVQAIFPVIDTVLAHFGRDEPATDPARITLQNDLHKLLGRASAVDNRWDDAHAIADTLSGLHYLLVSWVDDAFTYSRRWGDLWPGERFELKFDQYHDANVQNLRSERFRALAEEYRRRGLVEPAEAAWVLLHLGFRGDFDRPEIDAWLTAARPVLRHEWAQQLAPAAAPSVPAPPPRPRLPEPVVERSAARGLWLVAMAGWAVAALVCLARYQ